MSFATIGFLYVLGAVAASFGWGSLLAMTLFGYSIRYKGLGTSMILSAALATVGLAVFISTHGAVA